MIFLISSGHFGENPNSANALLTLRLLTIFTMASPVSGLPHIYSVTKLLFLSSAVAMESQHHQ